MEFKKGDNVRVANSAYGVITGEKKVINNSVLWQIDLNGRKTFKNEQLLELIPLANSLTDNFYNKNFGTYTLFRQFLTHQRIKGGLTNLVYSMKYGDVEFLPYQFKPVFKFITSNEGRLLIADEVGLGKTIEALYIWKELQARDGASRLLVVSPAMLRTKWKDDMEKHFGIDNVEIVDASGLRECLQSAANNSRKSFVKITSIQGIRYRNIEEEDPKKKVSAQYKLNKLLEDLIDEDKKVIDLVIFDEAHYMTNSETANFSTAERLNDVSKNMILLSATPVNNEDTDLYNLLKLLSPSEYQSKALFKEMFEENRYVVRLAHCFYDKSNDIAKTEKNVRDLVNSIQRTRFFSQDSFFPNLLTNIEERLQDDLLRRKTYDQVVSRYFYSNVFSRSKKKDVLKSAKRAAQTVHFKLENKELNIYKLCTKRLKDLSEKRNDRFYSFAIFARQRELASSIPAALSRWKQRGILMDYDESLYDDYEEDMELIDNTEEVIPNIENISDEDIQEIKENDSKYKMFLSTVKTIIEESSRDNINEKIVVFSFFRNTLQYLYNRLTEDGIGCVMIRGGLQQCEKDSLLATFKEDSKINVLLSSEVGAEGLDLQFSRVEINYDLPWNPMKLEQRIGRIDRIGQKSERINILNMVSSNTIEDRILEKLYLKINIFEESIGELDDILGKYTQDILIELLSSDLSDEDKEEEALKKINQVYNKIISIQNLEESAGLSRAYSDSIIDYVNTAEKNSRYIRKEDLINYMQDFFSTIGNGSMFTNNGDGTYELSLSDIDRNDFSIFLKKNNLFFAQINSSSIKCTFPQGKKSNRGCNIDVNHPLARWICSKTDEKLQEQLSSRNVFCVDISKLDVDRNIFSDDCYVFYLSEFSYDGLRKRKEILYQVCGVESGKIYSKLDAENMVSIALFNGWNTSNLASNTFGKEEEPFDIAFDKCVERSEFIAGDISAEIESENQSMYLRMKAKTDAYYSEKIEGLIRLVDEYKISGKTRIIPAMEGQIRNKKSQWELAMLDINQKRNPDITYDELLAGIIFLV